jgi:F-type H+-transporting ATPase subunit beta
MAEQMTGIVQSVIGVVVDFAFPEGQLPEIFDAIKVNMNDGSVLTFEVQQQLGNNVVRAVAMGSTDGLRR